MELILVYIYINNQFVGFSQICHKMSEFDITNFVKEGKNKIDVIVVKWCLGTYLEGQDKFRFTGIFRDVYLLHRNNDHIVDYKINTNYKGEKGFISFILLKGISCNVTFNNINFQVKHGQSIIIEINNVILWSAEKPYLYKLVISCGNEYIYENIGIRNIEIQDGIFKFNGKHIKLKGVNYHDFSYKSGQTVSINEIKSDLVKMKTLNINTIRTSHYPKCPEFYRLCDEMGFYVISEADIEAHGSITQNGTYELDTFNVVANMPIFKDSILDRVINLYQRDKNRSCIIIWSLGNESGYGINFRLASEYLKKIDDTRLLHYESANYADNYYDVKDIDIASRMYVSPEWLTETYLNDNKESKPLLLCEYSHSMGNSNGDLADYWKIFNSNDRFMGGCVWEWCDQAIWDRKHKGFNYGGDFEEILHDGAFCVDGLVTPDKKFKSGCFELKNIYSPVKISLNNNTNLLIKSEYCFEKIIGKLQLTYKTFSDIKKKIELDINLMPQQQRYIQIEDFNCLIVEFLINDQIIYKNSFHRQKFNLKLIKGHIVINTKDKYIHVNTKFNNYYINKFTGEIEKDSKKFFCEPFKINIWRAPLNNDMYILENLKNKGLDRAYSQIKDYFVNKNEIVFEGYLVADSLLPIFKYNLKYSFFENGFNIKLEYNCSEFIDFLPRIGFYFAINKKFNNVEYFGLGKSEAYCDKRNGAIKDYYYDKIDNMFPNYIYPQECGSHADTQYLKISKTQKNYFIVLGDFSFSALPYSIKQLEDAKHNYMLKRNNKNYVCIDGYMSGVGSASCGNPLSKQYYAKLNSNFSFDILLKS